ncbi:hypothetical protein B0H13DRAFT_1891087 [Mycena leptocephala]|nr:hypothetical protein B0H13DRAFT_1891087 [Mycena leptocephala]
MAHPPMKSKYSSGPTAYELKVQRHAERNEKARLRMARKRAELKTRPLNEQLEAAERSREYQARYRERNRDARRLCEAQRRAAYDHLPCSPSHANHPADSGRRTYQEKFGTAAYVSYLKAKRRRRIQRAQAKRQAHEAYHSADEVDDSEGDGDEDASTD